MASSKKTINARSVKSPEQKKSSFNFTKSLQELEEINGWFEQEDIDLDAGLSKFKRGLAIIKDCRAHLKEVENEFHEVRTQYEEKVVTDEPLPEE